MKPFNACIPISYEEYKKNFTDNMEDYKASGMIKEDVTEEDIDVMIKSLMDEKIYKNDKYQVNARLMKGEDIIHLSIKRNDKEPIHDWRDLQEIKNMIVGKEYEAIEIYPAESRLVDTANQYHLWVFNDENYRIPIGFTEKIVSYESFGGGKQRPKN